jgi:hypothetical protein
MNLSIFLEQLATFLTTLSTNTQKQKQKNEQTKDEKNVPLNMIYRVQHAISGFKTVYWSKSKDKTAVAYNRAMRENKLGFVIMEYHIGGYISSIFGTWVHIKCNGVLPVSER